MVRLRVRNLNYSSLVPALKKVGKVFVPVNRKTALYARKRLEQITGRKILSFSADLEGRKGYLFMLQENAESTTNS